MPKDKIIEDTLNGLESDIKGLVDDFFSNRKKSALQMALKFKDAVKGDLVKFASLRGEGKLTDDEYVHLTKFRTAQAKIEALAEVSISKTKASKLLDAVTDKLVDAALTVAVKEVDRI